MIGSFPISDVSVLSNSKPQPATAPPVVCLCCLPSVANSGDFMAVTSEIKFGS